MRPVNLLPEKDRPRAPSGALRGSAYVVVGTLGLVLVALVVYVLTVNQVADRRAQTDRAKQETVAAEARASRLGNFASFSEMKQTRETSVKTLAIQRFDWERLPLELARVLPPDVFSLEVEASVDGDTNGGSAGSSTGSSTGASQGGSSASASSSSSTAPAGRSAAAPAAPDPTMKLTACAPTQRDVATTMVRLRNMHRAKDVALVESIREKPSETSAQGAGAAPAAGAATDSDSCGETHGHPNVKFIVSVVFKAADSQPKQAPNAPATLGGGA